MVINLCELYLSWVIVPEQHLLNGWIKESMNLKILGPREQVSVVQ